jgi:hypothetical protein
MSIWQTPLPRRDKRANSLSRVIGIAEVDLPWIAGFGSALRLIFA